MVQYRFHFLNEENVILTAEEFDVFIKTVSINSQTNIYIDSRTNKGFNMHNMTYFEPEEVEDTGEGKVIKPPSASEIRAEKEEIEQNTPTNLTDQLTNPNLGEEK